MYFTTSFHMTLSLSQINEYLDQNEAKETTVLIKEISELLQDVLDHIKC